MRERGNETKYVLLQLLAVCFLASTGIFVRVSVLPPINTGLWRMIFSVPFLLFFARRELHALRRQDLALLLLAGVFFAGDLALFNLAFAGTSVANANLLANLTPFTIIPVSHFLFRERLPRHFLTGVAVALGGLVLLVAGKAEPGRAGYLGDLLAFSASFFYAGYLLVSYRMRDRYSSRLILLVSSFGAVAALAVAAALTEGLQAPRSIRALWPILGLTLCLQLIGHNLLSHCEGKLSVNLSSTVGLLQSVVAALYSFFFFDETLTAMEVAGMAVVIAGVYLVKRQYAPAEPGA